MREERLLERIARWGSGDEEGREVASGDLLLESVVRHLQRILNTRQGSVPIDPEFGVPDFTNLAGSYNAAFGGQIEQDIRKLIERYEPRLKSPRLKLREERADALSLSFELTGSVVMGGREVPVRLATNVGSQGRIRVDR
jgi:type VI secretion system protein